MKILFSPFLFVLSLCYGLAVFIDRALRSSHQTRLNCLTVSIGNITVGGTGKTPLVIRLAADLKRLRLKPAILSRGYQGFMKKGSVPSIVIGTSADVQRSDNSSGSSDEALLMAEKLEQVPIGVGKDRVKTAGILLSRFSPDVFILDDGFQHWPIYRDVDIVCVDATDPWGGSLLPLGRRREPRSQLRRAHAIVLTRSDLITTQELSEIEFQIQKYSPQAVLLRSELSITIKSVSDGRFLQPKHLYGKSVLALSALGRPVGFEKTLEHLGAVIAPLRFPDHHRYTEKDIEAIENKAGKFEGFLITTEKDWMKLRDTRWGEKGGAPSRLHILQIEMRFRGDHEQKWASFLEERITHGTPVGRS